VLSSQLNNSLPNYLLNNLTVGFFLFLRWGETSSLGTYAASIPDPDSGIKNI
jgi:hypothetical protein